MSARISAIAAISEGTRGLGKDNDLLWKISEDLKRFRELTSGHPIISGRKNFESMGRVLPNRTNIIVTRDREYQIPGAHVAHSIEEALTLARTLDSSEIFIIGGGEIFRQALHLTNRLYLTIIHADKAADVFFPEYEQEFQNVVEKTEREVDGLKFTYLTLDR